MDIVLVDNELKKLIKNSSIKSEFDLNNYVQPASIDLPVGKIAYHVKEKVLPFNKNIKEIIPEITLEKINLEKNSILLKGQTYLVPCLKLNLPQNLTATISPKSSVGRIDVMVRTIIDKQGLYDRVFEKFNGELWMEITPQSFNIKIHCGIPLTQMMIFEQSKKAEKIDFDKEKLVYDSKGHLLKNKTYKESLILTLNVEPNSLIGFEAVSTNDIINMSNINEYKPEIFFREVYSNNEGKVILEKDRFYILTTKEFISIPNHLSGEMVPFSHLVGELRAHYAGFFDPGFGYSKDNSLKGSRGVLEIRPHESITVYDGQPICLMDIFRNKNIPDKPYGFAGNNYFKQEGPKLAKFFK